MDHVGSRSNIYLFTSYISWEENTKIRDVNMYSEDIKPFILSKNDVAQKSDNEKRHLNIHSVRKPFKCDVCNKAFSLKVNLKLHWKVHLGEKPFICDQCDKNFS